jgi:hypothetical protein
MESRVGEIRQLTLDMKDTIKSSRESYNKDERLGGIADFIEALDEAFVENDPDLLIPFFEQVVSDIQQLEAPTPELKNQLRLNFEGPPDPTSAPTGSITSVSKEDLPKDSARADDPMDEEEEDKSSEVNLDFLS